MSATIPNWTSAQEAVKNVQSGNRVFLHGSACTPIELMNALADRASSLKAVELVNITTIGASKLTLPEYQSSFYFNCLFVSDSLRAAVDERRGDYVPVFLSEISRLFERGFLPLDVAMVQVSPPDRHGFCSLGTSVDVARSAVRSAKCVIALVNRHIPRTHGDGIMHISEADALVEHEQLLPELDYGAHLTEADMRIGKYVADLIDDGATLQMGIGSIPDAVLKSLTGHKDLGVHTEMFSDGLLPLIESGVVNNRFKKKHRGKVVSSFAVGTRKLYDMVDDNPLFTFLEASYVNDTAVIRQNPKVTAINSAIEIDLTGQICADSIGVRQFSGVGGQMDFIRGASLSDGGKPIIAMQSVTPKGVSKIVPFLKEGAGVVTTRAHTQYVVTEYGVAQLYGKNLRQRAQALRDIAHPEHRESLDKAIFERWGGIKVLILLLMFAFQSGESLMAQVGYMKSFDQAAVVSATVQASDAGIEIMKKGGNAVDAAVAVKFALAVTFPAAGNVGGGGFMVYRGADGTTAALDFREMAPGAAHRDMYLDKQGEVIDRLSTYGHLASGVPGTVDGMIKALEKYGTMPLETVIEPAIRLARDGFPLSWREAQALNRNRARFSNFESSTAYFTKPEGELFREGELFIQHDLANTLERIARHGRDGFYAGHTADLIVAEMKANGGIITHEDLERYESVWRPPLVVDYKEYQLLMMPPPSSGGIAVGQMLKKLEPYDLSRLGYNTPQTIHLMAEAMRRVYADRAEHLGDPDFYEVPVSGLLNTSYNRTRMSSFQPARASRSEEVSHGSPVMIRESEQTTHFSVVDTDGNAVAITTTLNGGYGSFVAIGGAGFLMNNEMDDFSIKPGFPNMFGLVGGDANAIEPGKRMLSSMTPTIVTRGDRLNMVLGTPGGSTIITTVLQVFLNVAEFGMNIQQAVAAPRIHHQWLPDQLYFEPFTFNNHTRERLEWMGHQLNERAFYTGQANCILITEDGRIDTGADPRGENHASGF